MTISKSIPEHHQAVVVAAIRALYGERAVVREIKETSGGPSIKVRVVALNYGIRTFWNRWTGRHPSEAGDETQD